MPSEPELGKKDLRGPGDEALRDPWSRSDRPVPRRVLRPLQTFLATETAGGLLLLAGVLVALIWANSPWSETYESFWHTPLRLGVGGLAIELDLRHFVNDALMAIFFFVVGLEIKRELVSGELREPRAAALPMIAALGGMAVPAVLYVAVNAGEPTSRGWGIPMATDIAFGLGVLALLGPRIPPGAKAFLLALAIVDDIGAIAVIAIFYSGPIGLVPLGIAGSLLIIIAVLQRIQVTLTGLYLALGLGVWLSTFLSGIHATIAGVALGLLTPAAPFQRPRAVSDEAHRVAEETEDAPFPPDADAHHWLRLAELSRDAVSPLARLEHLVHPWTSFLIVPVFALANAGVSLKGGDLFELVTSRVAIGIMLGLVLGKPLGITLASWAAVRGGWATLPEKVTWRHIWGVSAIAGIGFTVSLFIASLAFADREAHDAAKVGVLAASILAGLLGATILVVTSRRDRR